MKRAALFALVAVLAAGCVTEPAPPPTQCEETTDCDPGKTCADGVCYGLPPEDVVFAAVLYPPEGLALAPTEVTALEIAADGTIANLAFVTPTQVQGTVTFDGAPVEARIELRRPSRIAGGPDLVLTTEARAEGFRVAVPPSELGELYQVTIVPQGDQRLGILPGDPFVREVAPRASFMATLGAGDPEVEWELSPEGGLHVLEGRVLDVAQRGIEGATVTGFGGPIDGTRTQPSSIAQTGPDGRYRIYCPTAWADTIDLVVTVRTETDAVIVTRRDVPAPGPDEPGGEVRSPLLDVTLPPHPASAEFVLPVVGTDPAGGELAAAGARIVARATHVALEGDEVRFEATATADAEGRARIWLVPGEATANRAYQIDVISPPGSPLGSRWGAEVSIATPGVLPMLSLPSRTYVTGRIVGHDGLPVPGTIVQSLVSFRRAADLTDAERLILAQQAVEPVVVDDEGGFAIYLDPTIQVGPDDDSTAPTALAYDLDVTPPQDSLSPRWSYDEVVKLEDVVAPGLSYAVLPGWSLPAASFARALVVDATGAPVPGAELRIYMAGDPAQCAGRGPECVSPARLRALTTAGDDGLVRRLALPDPVATPASAL